MKVRLIAFILFYLQIFLCVIPLAAQTPSPEYILKDGKICIVEMQYNPLPVEGNVLAISHDGGSIHYIREIDGSWYAGTYELQEKHNRDYLLGNNFIKLHKLIVTGNVFYYLADIEKQIPEFGPQIEKILTRFEPESDERKTLTGVQDFILNGNEPVVVTSGELNCNGTILPLMVPGERRIEKLVDGRVIFISNGAEVEVIDILSLRNFYQYKQSVIYPYNGEYNVMLEFGDVIPEGMNEPEENMNYYQVYLNGFDSGRTETSPFKVSKNFTLKAETGKYCIVKAERWELDKDKGRYIRVNNVKQPAEMKIYIPENRIIRIKIEFDGTGYSLSQGVMEN